MARDDGQVSDTGAERAGAIGLIEAYRERFIARGNGLYAWGAYDVSRGYGLPSPAWVISYFDECAKALRQLSRTCPKNPAPAIAEAPKLKRPGRGGRGTIFSEIAADNRAVLTMMQFRVLERLERKKYRALEETLGSAPTAAGRKSATRRALNRFKMRHRVSRSANK